MLETGTLETIMLVACWSSISIWEIKSLRVGMSFIVGLVEMASLKLHHLLASTEWRNQNDVVFDHVGSHVAEVAQMKGKSAYRFHQT